MSKLYHHVQQFPLFVFTKVCKGCDPPTEKPIEEFDRDRSKPDGRATLCKACVSSRRKKRYAAMHPLKEKEELSPEQAAKREQERTYCRIYRLAHLEEDRARKKTYYAENQEQIREQQNAERRAAAEAYRATLPQARPGYKICATCEQEKPLEEFYKDKTTPDKHRYSCKDCCDKADKRRKNPGKRRKRRGIPVTPGYKWCYGCESEQLLSQFRVDPTKWDGLHPRCADCRSVWQHNYWQENRWHLLPTQRLRLRAFYEQDIEQSRAYNRQKRQKPQARLRIREGSRRRYARKKHAIVGEVSYARILERDGYFCHICEKPIDPTLRRGSASLVFDHVVSLYHHGMHSEDNIKPAHRVCNARKGKQILEEMTPHQRRGPDI